MKEMELYDISDIPVFPWVPEVRLWYLLAALALILILLPAATSLLKRLQNRPQALIKQALSDLRALPAEASGTGKAALIIRHCLSLLEGSELASLSAAELRSRAETTPPALAALLLHLASLDAERFRKTPGQAFDPAQSLKHFQAWAGERSRKK